jgi:hypothetical protein
MVKFHLIFEELLLELSGDEIYEKYYKDIDYDIFRQISIADPKTKDEGGKIKILGKYAKLLLDLYKRKNLNLEDLPNATEYLTHIYERNIPVNTGKIKGLPDLYQLVKQFIVSSNPKINEILRALDKEEYRVLLNGENWYIFQPLTEKASCYLGVSTVWCTTWGPLSLNKEYKDRENRFKSYNNTDTIYIMINKKDNDTKYQFHFPSKEFRDKENRGINTEVFLDENPEIKYFFFPSLIKDDVSEEELDIEIKRMKVLSSEDKNKLLSKANKLFGDNTLVNIIIDGDVDRLREMVGYSDVDITDDYVSFNVKELDGAVENVERTIGYYEYERENSSESLYNDLHDRFDNEHWEEISENVFKKYYEENKKEVNQNFGTVNYESFKENYFYNFIENEKVKDKSLDFIIDSAYESYRQKVQERINEYADYITFYKKYDRSIDIEFKKMYFVKFLTDNNILKISGEDKDILEMANQYVDQYNLDNEFEGIYDYDYDIPEYKVNSDEPFSNFINSYFEKLVDSDDVTEECVDARKKLNKIIEKFFDDSSEFENEDILIRLNSKKIDCSDLSVDVTYKNKDTNKISRGKVKVDNLPKYLTNYAIFENMMLFKKLLK